MSGIRAKPAPLRSELETLAEEARQRAADYDLDPDRVKAAVIKAAKEGLRVLVIPLAHPQPLRGTKAADALAIWAVKVDLQLDWQQPVGVVSHGVEVGQTMALVVRWQAPAFVPE